jgi:hypothetical protein
MKAFGITLFTFMALSTTSALAYPPPQSPQDAHCRQVAQAGVFSEPNPEGLGLFDHGYRIWSNCMRRVGARVPSKQQAKRPASARG